ncbi:MAG: hypothetical protein QOJ02_4267 [Acidobacteriota bacterium]|jgi:uncharacterized protein with ParB-like and HNH nuclease domain|nr:hypothetical protein [Acidobacteriota bacterium]
MKSDSLKISKVFSSGGDIHYVLPHFQREYTWDKTHWGTLLADACAIHEEMQPAPDAMQVLQEPEHFLGSLVVINDGTRNGTVTAFKLVDGQQRLTTISLLLCALSQIATDSHPALVKKIRKLLVNSDESGDVYFKILPTTKYGDRVAYMSVIQNEVPPPTESRIPHAFEYLQKELRHKISSGSIDPEKFFLVLTNCFQVVFIDLNQNESPYKIFESLNAKGKPLSQADLVRNYIAMKLPSTGQEEVFEKYWSKIEGVLQEKRTVGRSRLGELTAFLRHYLTMRAGVLCTEEHVYARFRDRIEKEFAESLAFVKEIATLQHFAEYYNKLLRPVNEPHLAIREAMERLNILEISTAYPFLLACYDAYDKGKLSADNFKNVLSVLENYLVRRYLVGEPTNYLNKLFSTLWGQINQEQFVESLREVLATKNYPSDKRVHQTILTRPVYDKNSLTRDRTTLILESINRYLSAGSGGYTVLDKDATIEHILPQTLSPEWREELGEGWEQAHRDYVHTLGNLSLVTQEWNSILSNAPFAIKRPKLVAHALRINSDYFSRDISRWDEEAIRNRAVFLTEKILAIWPALKVYSEESETTQSSKVEPANFHEECIKNVSRQLGMSLIKRSTVYYSDLTDEFRVICSVSKEYQETNEIAYWYTFRPSHSEFLSAATSSFVAYGCGSPDKVVLIPYQIFEPLTQNMHTTIQEERKYWHVVINERENRFYLAQPLTGNRVDVTNYLLPIVQHQ